MNICLSESKQYCQTLVLHTSVHPQFLQNNHETLLPSSGRCTYWYCYFIDKSVHAPQAHSALRPHRSNNNPRHCLDIHYMLLTVIHHCRYNPVNVTCRLSLSLVSLFTSLFSLLQSPLFHLICKRKVSFTFLLKKANKFFFI